MKKLFLTFLTIIIWAGAEGFAQAGNIVYLDNAGNILSTPYNGPISGTTPWGNSFSANINLSGDVGPGGPINGATAPSVLEGFNIVFGPMLTVNGFSVDGLFNTNLDRAGSAVPEPATMLIMGIGMLAMCGMRKRLAGVIPL